MAILVIAEHDHVSIKGATLNAIAAAKQIGGDVHVLVAGSDCAAAAQAAAKIDGVERVRVADATHYVDQTAENVAALVIANADGYTHILAPATTFGKNMLPRVCAADIRRQCFGHGQVPRRSESDYGAQHRVRRCRSRWRRDSRIPNSQSRSRPVETDKPRTNQVGAA